MKILTVIPIQKGVGKEELSYWTAETITRGAVVRIPLRNRTIPGLVVNEREARDLKAELRSAEFSLKKVSGLITPQLFQPAFLGAAARAAAHQATTLGQIISALAPAWVFDHLEGTPLETPTATTRVNNLKTETLVLGAPDSERLSFYKSLIREAFARKTSIFFCLPSSTHVSAALTGLGKGINDYTYVLHGDLTKKVLRETWTAITTTPHPVLIIATPTFLSIPRTDISTFILDQESAGSYKQLKRPFLDIRTFLPFYSQELGARLIIGDTVLRTETFHGLETGRLIPASPPKYRSVTSATTALISSKTTTTEKPKKEFRALSEELRTYLTKATQAKHRTLVLANRRGLSPITICSDCETVLTCKQCSAPLAMHQTPTDTKEAPALFVCHKCGQKQTVEDECPNCGSWRLSPLGIGVERTAVEIAELYPDSPLITFSSDTIKTAKQGQAAVVKFLETPGSILVGTELVLHYLTEQVETVAVATVDAMFAIPDFRINEKIFNLLIRARELTSKQFVIQTRNPEAPVFEDALRGNVAGFHRRELAERKVFNYPPFTTALKITREGTKNSVLTDMKRLEQRLAEYTPLVYPSFTNTIKGRYRMHALLLVPPETWVNPDLAARLKSLPPSFSIDVNPESIIS